LRHLNNATQHAGIFLPKPEANDKNKDCPEDTGNRKRHGFNSLRYSVDNVTALFKNTRPQENQNQDKAHKEKPPDCVTLNIKRFRPPSFEAFKNVHIPVPF
jgi:hypothetical protein